MSQRRPRQAGNSVVHVMSPRTDTFDSLLRAATDELYTKGQVNFPAAILVKSLSLPCVGPLIDRSLWGAAVPTSGYPRDIAGLQHI